MRRSKPMIDLTQDVRSLTDFKRNTGEMLERIKESGHPLVLTINGKPELVVQDAASYQRILEALERATDIDGARRGLEDLRAGRTKPLDDAFQELRSGREVSR